MCFEPETELRNSCARYTEDGSSHNSGEIGENRTDEVLGLEEEEEDAEEETDTLDEGEDDKSLLVLLSLLFAVVVVNTSDEEEAVCGSGSAEADVGGEGMPWLMAL